MKVAILTLEQKDLLQNQEIQSNWFYNITQDCNANWVISDTQIDGTINPDYLFLKTLPLIDWCGSYSPSGSTIN